MFWDLWHQYKYYLVAGTVVLVVVIILSVIMITNWSASRDVIFMADIKKVSYALESYYEQHHSYPVQDPASAKASGGQAGSGSGSDLRQSLILSDNGFGKADGTVYYQGAIQSGKASYTSDGQAYTISFKLHNKWSDLGAKGTKCTVQENYQVSCQ